MKKPLSAFRLIELLVVTSVVAILIRIARPVFGSAQEKAWITQELSNLLELGIATRTFADLHSESLSRATSKMAATGPMHDLTRFRWEP
jgi:type II secretory pathway pseudopilin PulG